MAKPIFISESEYLKQNKNQSQIFTRYGLKSAPKIVLR